MTAPTQRVAVRLALFYAAMFALIGVHLPFWPVWLQSRGLGATEIGVVLAIGVSVKVIVNPLVAGLADRLGRRRPIMVALAFAALAAFAQFAWTGGFWSIAAVTVLFFAAWSPIMPLGESLTMLAGGGRQLDYGRIRAWGSLAFIVTSVGAGYLLVGRPADTVFGAILAIMVLAATATLALPGTRTTPAEGGRFAPLEVLRDGQFRLFLLAAALIQASHSVYYGFGTLHWKAAGHSESVIGWLWAEGVLAEIVLFAFGARLIGRLGPGVLMGLGGAAGAVRWAMTATAESLTLLIVLQALHAFSFGATHLGAIHYIAGRFPTAVSASAQSLYSAVVMGLGMGLSSLLAGRLYAAYGGGAYAIMAGLAAFGVVTAVLLVNKRP